MSVDVQKIAAIAGSAILVGSGALTAAPYLTETTNDQPALVAVNSSESAAEGTVSVRNVQGAFSYDQAVVSSNDYLSSVFAKAASSLCASLPEYHANLAGAIAVSAGDLSISATVDEMTEEEGTQSYTMACACASNLAGGGAVANADVSGVSLETLATMIAAQ